MVMLNVEIPTQKRVFCGLPLESGYSVVEVLALVVASIDDQRFLPSEHELASQSSTSGARAYDNVLVVWKTSLFGTSDRPAGC